MKQHIPFNFTIVLFLFSILCSCGGGTQSVVIGVSQCSDDEWRTRMNEEIMREALFYPGLNIEIRTANDDNSKQIADIEYFLSKKVDLLVIAPNEAEAITPVIEKAYSAGVPVVLVDRKIASDKYTAFVGGDNYELGRQAGSYIANRLGGNGSMVEITGLKGSSSAVERHKGMADVLAQYPGINIIASADASWNKEDARCKFDSILQACPDIDLVFAQNDRMASGAYLAAKARGREKDMLFVGVDALAGPGQGVELVADSIMEATFIYPTGGDKTVQTAMDILGGKGYAKENILSSALVNRANAKVMLMQNRHIDTLAGKIGVLDGKLDMYLMRYSAQKMLLYACLVIAALLAMLLFLVVKAYWTKIRLNHELSIQKQKAEEATKAKLAFFTNVSHDFRTPLTLIADPVKRLVAGGMAEGEARFLLGIIDKNVTVLLRLVNQAMDFRKFEEGKLEMRLSGFDMAARMREWAGAFSTLALQKHISLGFHAEGGDYRVTADAEMMERLTYNLLSNAFKFTPGHGRIEIRLRDSEDGRIEMRFSDTGTGMPAEHVRHIFDSFYQADVHHGGSGIGLALVKAFVEMHHGSIDVESSENSGTTFRITMPRKQEGGICTATERKEVIDSLKEGAVLMAAQEGHTAGPGGGGDGGKGNPLVLVIDDNADVRGYVKSLLDGRYRVIEAADGKEGLKQAIANVPDVVICDVMMPVMDGMECCRQLKAEPRTSHIPVMMLTAYSMDEQKIKGYECGADSYISKPFGSELLLARLRNLMENRRRLKDFFGGKTATSTSPIAETDKGFVEKLRSIIEENLDRADFGVEEMGEKIGFSRVQLYRKTKALTGYSPNELLRITRLEKAAAILKVSAEKSVSEVAYETGFSSPSYFTKCYKEHFGTSPTEGMKKN